MSKIKSEANKEASNHLLETNTTQSAFAGDGPGYAGDALTSSFPNNSAKSLQRAVNSISEAASPASRLGLFQKAVRNSQNSNQTATRLARTYKATTASATLTRTAAPAVLQRLAGAPPAWIGSLASTIAEHSGGLVSTGQVGSLLTTAWNSGTGAVSSVLNNLERFAVQAFEFIDLEGIIAMLAEGTEALVAGVLSIEVLPVAVAVIVIGGVAYLIVTDKNPWDLVNQYKSRPAPAPSRPSSPSPASRPQPPASDAPDPTFNNADLPDPAVFNAPITIPEQPLPEFHPQPAPKPYTNPALATRAWAKYKQGWDYYNQVLQNSQSDPALSQVFLDSQSIPSRTLAMVAQKINDLENDLRIFDPYHNGEGGFGPQVEQAAHRIQNTRIGAVDKAMQDMNTVLQQVRRHAQQEAQRNQQIATGQIPLPPSETVNQGGVRVTTYSQATVAAADRVYQLYDQGDQLVRHIQGSLSQLTGGDQSQIGLLQQHLPLLTQLDTLVGQLNDFAKQNRGMGWADTMGNPNLSQMIPLANQIEQLIPQVQSEKQAFDQQVSTAGLRSLLTIPATHPNPLPPSAPPQRILQTEPQTDSAAGGRGGSNNGRMGGGTNEPGNNNREPDPNNPLRMVGGLAVNLPQHYDTKPGENAAPDHWESDAGRQLIDDLYRFSNDSRTKNAMEALKRINSKTPPVGDNEVVDWVIAIYNWEELVNSHKPLDVKDHYPQHFTNPPAGREKERQPDTIWVFDHPMIKDVAGNLLYGYVGRVAGFSNDMLLQGAGLAQTLGNFFMHGNPEGIGPGIDDPKKHQSPERAGSSAPSEPAHNPIEQGIQSIDNRVQQGLEALQIPQRIQIARWLATHPDTRQWDRPTDQIQIKLGLELFMQHDYLFAQPIGGQADMAMRLRILQQTLEKHLSQIPSGPTPDEVGGGPHNSSNPDYVAAQQRQQRLLSAPDTFGW